MNEERVDTIDFLSFVAYADLAAEVDRFAARPFRRLYGVMTTWSPIRWR